MKCRVLWVLSVSWVRPSINTHMPPSSSVFNRFGQYGFFLRFSSFHFILNAVGPSVEKHKRYWRKTMVFVDFGWHTPRHAPGEFALYCVLRKPLAVASNDGRYLYSGIGFIPPGRNRRRSERKMRTRVLVSWSDVTADVNRIVPFERFLVFVLLRLFFFLLLFLFARKILSRPSSNRSSPSMETPQWGVTLPIENTRDIFTGLIFTAGN